MAHAHTLYSDIVICTVRAYCTVPSRFPNAHRQQCCRITEEEDPESTGGRIYNKLVFLRNKNGNVLILEKVLQKFAIDSNQTGTEA